MKRKLLVLLLFGAIVTHLSFAQTRTLTGTVKDDAGDKLPGVIVIVQGTTNGTVTDAGGFFSLPNVPSSANLKFSFIGLKEQIVPVGSNTTFNITLSADVSEVDDVVVGYGTQKKVDVIGAISTIKTEELVTVPTPTIAESVMGRTSGVFAKIKSAQPGDYS